MILFVPRFIASLCSDADFTGRVIVRVSFVDVRYHNLFLFWLFVKTSSKIVTKITIGPLQLTVTWCKKRHVETQEAHWDKTNKELTSFKMVIFFVCFVPVRLLRLNVAVSVPCDCKLQRAYSLF